MIRRQPPAQNFTPKPAWWTARSCGCSDAYEHRDAETILKDAFFTDVRPLLAEWRKKHNLEPDPMAGSIALEGMKRKRRKERGSRRDRRGAGYA